MDFCFSAFLRLGGGGCLGVVARGVGPDSRCLFVPVHSDGCSAVFVCPCLRVLTCVSIACSAV